MVRRCKDDLRRPSRPEAHDQKLATVDKNAVRPRQGSSPPAVDERAAHLVRSAYDFAGNRNSADTCDVADVEDELVRFRRGRRRRHVRYDGYTAGDARRDNGEREPVAKSRTRLETSAVGYCPGMARRRDLPHADSRGALDGGEAAHVAPSRIGRVRVFLDRSELPWLPVSEAAFLLWVLVAFFTIWALVAIALLAT